jgi:hypothetical protein
MHNALQKSTDNNQLDRALDGAPRRSVASALNPLRISMKKKETLNFRVSADFKRRLTEEAKKERRSLTNYLETTLTKLWEQQGSTKARKREAT